MKLTKTMLHNAACNVSERVAAAPASSAYSCYRVADAVAPNDGLHVDRQCAAIVEYTALASEYGAPLQDGDWHSPPLQVFENTAYIAAMSYGEARDAANLLRFDFLNLLAKAI